MENQAAIIDWQPSRSGDDVRVFSTRDHEVHGHTPGEKARIERALLEIDGVIKAYYETDGWLVWSVQINPGETLEETYATWDEITPAIAKAIIGSDEYTLVSYSERFYPQGVPDLYLDMGID